MQRDTNITVSRRAFEVTSPSSFFGGSSLRKLLEGYVQLSCLFAPTFADVQPILSSLQCHLEGRWFAFLPIEGRLDICPIECLELQAGLECLGALVCPKEIGSLCGDGDEEYLLLIGYLLLEVNNTGLFGGQRWE